MVIDLIFCSPLKRTIHTASILNVNKLEITTDDRLIERDFGSFTLKSVELIKDKSKLYNLKENEFLRSYSKDNKYSLQVWKHTEIVDSVEFDLLANHYSDYSRDITKIV